ncbi:FecR domain-containing protein [Chitinophaga horti]|uniref:FecR domain-containing protein n=1 Tax=Chitinophaga horti TaxID=2920382 RepID=A0ABY6IV94_9BACT|nr:FecR domain-containing protein [Chitinophaga horti]UYQ91210.1 FecR domain-containing protein [Chitinophaga horti]
MKESNPELARLLEKYRQGQCTDEEQARLFLWLDELERSSAPMPLPGEATRTHLRDAFVSRVSEPRKVRISYKRYIAAAAILCGCIAAGTWLLTRQANTSSQVAITAWDTISTRPQEMRTIRLSDNSQVALNAGTQLRISKAFGNSERRVEILEGEAWFDVQKDAAHPFVVQCGTTETRVLGTRFVISAYKGLPQMKVQVTEGKVAVSLPGANYPAVMPGQAILLQQGTGESAQVNFDRASFDPLQQSNFIQNGSFEELALRIRNTFGYMIIAANDAVAQRRFTGEFRHNEQIRDILQKFSDIHNGTFRMDGDKIYMQ